MGGRGLQHRRHTTRRDGGCEEAHGLSVTRKLQELAATYNWQRERTDAGWQYRLIAVSKVEPAPQVAEPPSEDINGPKEKPAKCNANAASQPLRPMKVETHLSMVRSGKAWTARRR